MKVVNKRLRVRHVLPCVNISSIPDFFYRLLMLEDREEVPDHSHRFFPCLRTVWRAFFE